MSAASDGLARSIPLDLERLRDLSGTLALLATIAAVVSLFAISPILLEHYGVSYITAGGGAMAKFHPSTFLAVAALALRCCATSRPIRTGWHLATKDPGVLILLSAVGITAMFAALISKTPVTPVIDTFVLPVLVLILLRDLDPLIAKRLALLIACILAANAALAMIEFARGSHFVTLDVAEGTTSDPTRSDAVFDWRAQLAQDWRATALLGHPLINGLITACLMICLAVGGSRWLPPSVKVPLALSQLAAMFAFGARASLVLSLLVLAVLLVEQAIGGLRRGARLPPRAIALALVVVAIAVGGAGILSEAGFFDRTIERFADDSGSAASRLTMFELFRPFGWSDLLLGPDQDVVSTWQRAYGLEFGIESAWVGLALNYGLVVTGIIVVGLVAFTRSVASTAGRGATTVLLFYFVSVSATASLSGKTTSLAMTVALVLLFLRREERRQTLIPLLDFRTS